MRKLALFICCGCVALAGAAVRVDDPAPSVDRMPIDSVVVDAMRVTPGGSGGPTLGTSNLVFGLDNQDPRPGDLLMTIKTDDPLATDCTIGDVSQDGLMSGLAFGPGDVLYGLNQTTRHFVSINPATGASVVISTLPLPPNAEVYTGMAWDRVNSKMYLVGTGAAAATGAVWTVNPADGVLGPRIQTNNTDNGAAPFYIDAAADAGVLYGLDLSAERVVKIVGTQAQPLGPLGGQFTNFSQGMAFDPNTSTLYIGPLNNNPVYSDWGKVNTTTGTYTRIDAIGNCFTIFPPITELGDFDVKLTGGGCDPCDMDCDGDVDSFDIENFIDVLFNQEPPCSVCAGDVNGDNVRNAFDIDPFIACLFGP